MSTSLRISVVFLAASLVAGACQSGGVTTTPTAIPTAVPTAIRTARPAAIPTTTTLTPHGDFSLTRSLSIDRSEHTATLLANGKVLITGGREGLGHLPLASAELYDPDTESFSSTGSMSSSRTGHTATLLANGKVLISGGIATNDNSPYLASAELYDPNTGSFSSTGSMSSSRTGHTSTLLASGKVLLTGGAADASSVLASAELYDPGTGSFSSTGSMSSPRFWHTATLLASGKVLIAGGTTYNGESGLLASAELYDPGTGAFSSTGSMSGPRLVHSATLLASGKVLITGGSGAPFEPSLASVELYDPGTGSFNSALSMTSGRAFHTMTLLASGEILIFGGGGYQVWPELYTP